MAASAAYYSWVRTGMPFTLATPLADLQQVLQGYGFTVYAYPDVSHQMANPPEDHTPYSATGWPEVSPHWYGFAIDVMPKYGDARSLTPLAKRLIADKDAGVPGIAWLKYINWTDADGKVWHTSWQPDKHTAPSGDSGHIHLSGRSDYVTNHLPHYDPIARMAGDFEEDDDDMGSQIGPVFLERTGYTSINIPPVQAGLANPRPAWLNVHNDTNGQDYALRIFISNGTEFHPLGGNNGVYVIKGNTRLSVPLPQYTSCVSIMRVSAGQVPLFTGSLSVVFEQGAVVR